MADYVWHAEVGQYPINDKNPILIQRDYVKPFPYSIWRIDEHNSGYPYTYIQNSAKSIQHDYVRPFPYSLWRIDENNGGYPYTYILSCVATLPPPEPQILPVSQQGEATIIDDTKSIEYKRVTKSGYTNPDLIRFQDNEFEEGDLQKIGIFGLNSYRYIEKQNYTEGSTDVEIP